MEITQESRELVVGEQRSFMPGVISIAAIGAGLSLTLGAVKSYGFQAWYRTYYWLGLLIALVAGAAYLTLFSARTRVTLSVPEGTLRYAQRRRFQPEAAQAWSLSEVQRFETEAYGGGYRLTARLPDGQAVLSGMMRDRRRCEQAAGRFNAGLNRYRATSAEATRAASPADAG